MSFSDDVLSKTPDLTLEANTTYEITIRIAGTQLGSTGNNFLLMDRALSIDLGDNSLGTAYENTVTSPYNQGAYYDDDDYRVWGSPNGGPVVIDGLADFG